MQPTGSLHDRDDLDLTPLSAETHRPRISLGLPVYNGEKFIDECIASIVGQTFSDFELIICDNASTDCTVQLVSRWASADHRIRLHRAPTNKGAAANFNWCFELARGEFFKWCAADDLIAPTFLETCIEVLDSDPEAVLAYPGTIDIDEAGNVLGPLYDFSDQLEGASCFAHRRFFQIIFLPHHCTSVFGLIRANRLRETSLIGTYVGSDLVLLAELAMIGRFRRVRYDLFFHREHTGRSIRGEFSDIRQRSRWFYSNAKGRAYPFWRFLGEYLRIALFRTSGFRERLLCCREVMRWLYWGYWRELVKDVKYHVWSATGRRV